MDIWDGILLRQDKLLNHLQKEHDDLVAEEKLLRDIQEVLFKADEKIRLLESVIANNLERC